MHLLSPDDTESVNNQTTADLKTQLEHSTESINVLQQQLAEKLKIIDKNNVSIKPTGIHLVKKKILFSKF